MAELGFGWRRVTVAEVEAGDRRVSLEEVVALGLRFEEPALQFLLPA